MRAVVLVGSFGGFGLLLLALFGILVLPVVTLLVILLKLMAMAIGL